MRTFDDDEQAIAFLEQKGYVLTRRFCWVKPDAGHVPTKEDWEAAIYLFDEWDFGGFVNPEQVEEVLHVDGSKPRNSPAGETGRRPRRQSAGSRIQPDPRQASGSSIQGAVGKLFNLEKYRKGKIGD